MCGIVGWAGLPSDKKTLKRMMSAIRHRGPDSEGIFANEDVSLGFQRLAIIDLSKKGNQPMKSATGKSAIVFNGEVYNFKDLKEKVPDYKFQSSTDTEVILALYEKYGKKCVEFLRGMFAFVIWDVEKKSLFIARDRLGQKPLYYAECNEGLVFASELSALRKYPGLYGTLNEDAVRLYVQFGYVPTPLTIINEAKKLPAGHTLTFRDGKLVVEKYWDLDFNKKTNLSYDEAKEKILEILEESVKLRMIADVPLGVFLSGGLDSSTIVALMAKNSDKPVKTFSVGFEEAEYSELKYARLVAEKYKTDHHEIILKPDFVRDIPKIMKYYDEPFADASAIPTYYVAKATREHVTVALNGDGGDENFAGYERYVRGMRARLIRLPPLPKSNLPLTGKARIIEILGMSNVERFHSLQTMLPQNVVFSKVKTELENPFKKYYSLPKAPLDKWVHADIKSYLQDDLLVKVDRATMAVSLEGRSPLLDHKLMEFTASLPAKWKLSGKVTKKIFRDTVRDLLPEELLKKPKQGFAVPVNEWMKGALGVYARKELLESDSQVLKLLNRKKIEKLVDEFAKGKPHGYRLWNLLMLREWEKANF